MNLDKFNRKLDKANNLLLDIPRMRVPKDLEFKINDITESVRAFNRSV